VFIEFEKGSDMRSFNLGANTALHQREVQAS